MKLCLSCGIIDFRRILKAMPPELITWWMAFDALTGAVTGRDLDHRAAIAKSIDLNIHKSDESPDVDVAQVLAAFGPDAFVDAQNDLKQLARDQRTGRDYEAEAAREVARIPRHPNA